MNEARTPKEFFEMLPSKFKPEKAAGIDVIVQISINGSNGGDWIVTIENQKLRAKEGIHPSSMLELKMEESDFMDLIKGKISSEKAFMTGKIKFKGNIGVALRLKQTGFL